MAFHKYYFLILLSISLMLLIPNTVYADHSNQTYTVIFNATHNSTVPCFATTESNMCGFASNPWGAIKHAMFVDYLGDWFIAIVYFPIIAVIFVLTRNGTYTGLVGITIVAGTNQAETLAFEVTLPLVAISTGLAFFEVMRKRTVE